MKKIHLLVLPLLSAMFLACGAEDDVPDANTAGQGNVPDGAPAPGTTYSLIVEATNWFAPPGVGSEIGAFVPEFLFTVDPSGAPGVFATGDGNHVQDTCNPTTTLPAPVAGVFGPFDPRMYIRHADPAENVQVNTTVRNMKLTNVFPGDPLPPDENVIATMDLRELGPMFTLLGSSDPTEICTTLAGALGASCEPCPQDSQPFCLTILADGVQATVVDTQIYPIATQPATCPLNPAPTP